MKFCCFSYEYFSQANSIAIVNRRKIEDIGKMTALTQEEILQNTKTVVQGLDALKQVNSSLIQPCRIQ